MKLFTKKEKTATKTVQNQNTSEAKKSNTVKGNIYSNGQDASPPDQQAPLASEKPKIVNPLLAVEKQNIPLIDVLSPGNIEIDTNHIQLNDAYVRTLFTKIKGRFASPGWLEPIVNF